MARITRLAALLAVALAWLGPGRVAADVPQLVSYQGVLMQDDAVVVPDGPYSLRFRVFRQEALGTPVFEQTLQVQVTNGLYNVLLSDNPPWTLAEAFSQTPAYMEVAVLANGGGVPQDVVLEPRQQIASVPYALNVGAQEEAPEEVIVREVRSTHVGTAISNASNPVVWTPLKTSDGSANLEVTVTPPAAGYVIEVGAVVTVASTNNDRSVVGSVRENGISVGIPGLVRVHGTFGGQIQVQYVNATPVAGTAYTYGVSAHASGTNVQQGASAVDGIQPGASLKVVMRPAQP
jgi:hypothetical protein